MSRLARSFLISTCCISAVAAAADDNSQVELDAVEISATRLRSVSDLDVPASMTTVMMDAGNNRAQVNVTEMLTGIPGVTALDRQNYAQDTQLSIRGFGSRSTFGVRGVRLYADGIPATTPDGQGQLSHFNLMGADYMQVMRGPFSSLYGNSSGGVVQIWSRPGTPETSARVRATYGSDDARTIGGQILGTAGVMDYNLSASRFQTDGYRPHSAARRDSINLRLGFDIGESRSLTLVGNYLDIPEAQDPLGLTPDDWRIDPQQTASVAEQYNTRKSVEQLQAGVIFEQRLGSHTLRAAAYGGNRKIVQFLSIPRTAQASATHSGGVVDLDNDYNGADLRWSWVGSLLDRPLEVTMGATYDEQEQLRRGYENFVGTELGVRGTLRRDETNTVRSFDQFAQAWWHPADRWSLLAGLRHSRLKFESADRYVVGTNGDDSGSQEYGDTTIVGGVMFHASESLRLYASMGDGFETPTFNEVAYRADGGPGLAFDLRPAISRNYETGAKWRSAGGLALDVAAFIVNTRDDLIVVANSGGRSRYGNAPRSRRRGIETALQLPLGNDWQLDASVTWLDAEFRTPFATCLGTPCPTPNVTVPSGTAIPGIPRRQAFVRLSWAPGEWETALELSASSSIAVRDVPTPVQPEAPGYGVWNAEIGRDWRLAGSTLRSFARIENLLDKAYVGSVIVNDGNGRYFESGTDRTAMLGLQWRWH